jgi:hypothetical protein
MFFDLHINLLEEFPNAAGNDGAKRIIPCVTSYSRYHPRRVVAAALARVSPCRCRFAHIVCMVPVEGTCRGKNCLPAVRRTKLRKHALR